MQMEASLVGVFWNLCAVLLAVSLASALNLMLIRHTRYAVPVVALGLAVVGSVTLGTDTVPALMAAATTLVSGTAP